MMNDKNDKDCRRGPLFYELFRRFFDEGLKKAPSALQRIADALQKPPKPIMSQEDFDKLPYFEHCILICNVIGCKNVVCTHGLLCVEHTLNRSSIPQIPLQESKKHD
jgi:hypothetical protein